MKRTNNFLYESTQKSNHKNRYENKHNYDKNFDFFFLIEKKIETMHKEIREIKEAKEINNILNTIKNKLLSLEKIVTNLQENFKKFSEKFKDFPLEIKDDNIKNKFPLKKQSKIFIDADVPKYKNISDFITIYKYDELELKYFEPHEIEKENEKIRALIKDIVYDNYLPEKEISLNELAGKFLYSIGGISRKSQTLANNIYLELFKEYKKFLENNNQWLTFNHEEDRRNLSIWVKNSLKEKEFFECYSNSKINEIRNYLNDEKTNDILIKIFKDLIKLYTKCLLSFPLVEAKYTNNNCRFEYEIMLDIILKGRDRIVNFCYLPGLISNGQFIKGGKFYVFTFKKDKTYQKKDNLYENEITFQNYSLYSIPNINEMELRIEKEINKENNNCNLLIKTNPLIPSELKPKFRLIKLDYLQKYKLYSENMTGNFIIEKKYLNDKFLIIINYLNKKIEYNFSLNT